MRDGVVVVVVGDDRQHRAEDLLLGDGHLVVDVGEHGRLDVPALVEARRATAAGDDTARPRRDPCRCSPRPGRAGARRPAGRPRSRGRAGRRPSSPPTAVGRARRRPRRSGARRREDAGLGDAGLAVVHDRVGMRPATVASRSASSRTIAADLPPSSRVQRLSCSPQIAPILRPATRRAGEGDLVDVGVTDQVLADLAAGRDDVEHTVRQPGLLRRSRRAGRRRAGSPAPASARRCSRRAGPDRA